MKRKNFLTVWSMLLSIALCFGFFPMGAFAQQSDSDFVIERYHYLGSDRETVTLMQYTGNADVVVVPDGVEDIGEAAFHGKTMTEVILPDSVKNIGYEAFSDCPNLKTITFPESVRYIGQWAFLRCTSLEQAILPKGLEGIGFAAFAGCTALSDIWLPTTVRMVGDSVFEDTAWLKNQYTKGDSAICNGVLLDAKVGGNTLTVPYGVERMASIWFSWEGALVVPPTITSFDGYDFHESNVHTVYGLANSNTKKLLNQAKAEDVAFIPLSLNQNSVVLECGKSVQLSLNSGSKAVWKTSNPQAAKVSDTGKVTAIKPGTAVITANLYGTEFACKVAVKSAKQNAYTVKRGDCLWSIAARHLGNGARYTELMKINHLKTTTLHAGQKLILPEK